jgi:hypothetical protein
MGPSNGIIGDAAYGTSIPQTEVPEQDLSREKSMAKFSKTAEFKSLQAAIEARIEHYQAYLPGNSGVSIQDLPNEERAWRWLAADVVIAEFKSILGAYEQAAEAVKNESISR